jgi:hypothetical protein
MAVLPLCARLGVGQDISCVPVQRKYFQQAVVINRTDIAEYTINKTDYDTAPETPLYNVEFTLKAGAQGYRFSGSENGSIYFGRYNKSTSDLGLPQYSHEVQMLVAGASEEAKAILESLDKGSYVVAMQFGDGTVEVYGIQNGVSTGDYTYSIQENGGGTPIVLSSNDGSPESSLPLVYKSTVAGDEEADFDSAFAQPAA